MITIRKFYSLTFPRFWTNEKKLNKILNMAMYAEYLMMQKICDKYVRRSYRKCQKPLNTDERKNKIIVSVTTIPSRVETIPIMLKSIFNQTMMPDRVVLWLTDETKDRKTVERLLSDEIEHGLEIRYIKDVQVHTKYFYAMKENPNAIIITVDDDILYPENLIEELYGAYLKNPHCVIAARTHEITFEGNAIGTYKNWNKLAPGKDNKDHCLLATGVGGVLYPPHILYKDWKNVDLFLRLAGKQDDIWLKIMETLQGTDVVKLYKYTRENFIISSTQKIALSKQNVNEGRNDIFVSNCVNYYGLNANDFR